MSDVRLMRGKDRQVHSVVIAGAGHRGRAYAEQMRLVGGFRIVGVAEPDPARRAAFASGYGIPESAVFVDARQLLERDRLADVLVVSLMDQDHRWVTEAALARGYSVLLEKPMATSLEDCEAIVAAEARSGRLVMVCHVLRYHRVNEMVKTLLEAGEIGQVTNIDHVEALDPVFFASMFVRGQWNNDATSTFFLMAKCCHDLDLIAWFAGQPCLRVSSFGSLDYFRASNAPVGATDRCVDGCAAEPECPFSALKIHLGGIPPSHPMIQYPDAASDFDLNRVYNSSLEGDGSDAAVRAALAKGPFGRCVFRCDNNAVDRQVVAMEFANGIVATFTVSAFNARVNQRLTRIHGTDGVITCDYKGNWIEVRNFRSNLFRRIPLEPVEGGHGGADHRIIESLHEHLESGPSGNRTSAQISLDSHRIVFAAEEARRSGRVIQIGPNRENLRL